MSVRFRHMGRPIGALAIAVAVLVSASPSGATGSGTGPSTAQAKKCKELRSKSKRQRCKARKRRERFAAMLRDSRLTYTQTFTTPNALTREQYRFCANGATYDFAGQYKEPPPSIQHNAVFNGTWQVTTATFSGPIGTGQVAITRANFQNNTINGTPGPIPPPPATGMLTIVLGPTAATISGGVGSGDTTGASTWIREASAGC